MQLNTQRFNRLHTVHNSLSLHCLRSEVVPDNNIIMVSRVTWDHGYDLYHRLYRTRIGNELKNKRKRCGWHQHGELG